MASASTWFRIGCLAMSIGIGAGAFGAHALKESLSPYHVAVYEKAVFYHLVHALALTIVAIASEFSILPLRIGKRMCKLFCLGIIFFSGSLYGLAVTDIRWLGAITPIGGTCFIIAWLLPVFGRKPKQNSS